MTRVRAWAPWAAIVVVLILALAYAQSGSGRQALTDLGLKSKPDRYVALSFASVQSLPYSDPTGTPLSFAVTINNHRGASVVYTLTATGAGSTKASGRGAVIVPDGSKRTVNVRVSFRCVVPKKPSTADSIPTARVVITLMPSNESITHTMYCRAPV